MFKALSASLLLGTAVTLFAQTAAPTLPAPLAPQQIIFRHWPKQFVQWIGTELPYTMIELYVDPGTAATPLYEVVLTDRASGNRVHYTNQQAMFDLDKRSGAQAYLTNIQLDNPAAAATGATYLLRFVDHTGQPVSWQFIQGSDMSERGGGSSPAGFAPPVLVYRTQSAVAGEGTALKIGNTVSVAEVWTEISQPPYFIAYHGAVSEDVDIAVFTGAPQQWSTVSAPNALTAGGEWKLKSQDGLARTLRVQGATGTRVTLSDEDEHAPGRTVTVDADYSNGTWTFNKMHYAGMGENANQGITINFAPGVSAASTPSKFEVIAGRKTHIASGTVHTDVEQQRTGWEFKDPEWLHGKTAWVNAVMAKQSPAVKETASK